MQTEADSPRRPIWRSRWWMPAFSVFLGTLILAASAAGGNTGDGLKGLAVMTAVGALFLFGRRSESLQGLGGPARDERWEAIDLRATAASGLTLLLVVLGAWLYELSQGRDGEPWAQLAAVAGVAYVIAVIVLRARS